ncbi:serine/threonine-protein kinase SAPK7-like [Zingiber officinale]|uniref:serine/threonine-protein kinase SAPK7-like n=1 Tax=Zingiber officinale TaxID=94328 RepID=UPI001C4C4717|nr:serine/threonine-protein kinase SAPK7-like [Zingiber officinale]
MERYEIVKTLGSGEFGVARMMKNKKTGEVLAMMFFRRGEKIDKDLEREIINRMSLFHPNVIQFEKLLLTPTHLVIAMEYAGGGELYPRIELCQRFTEDESRYFFQQLINAVSYCHFKGVCHQDLKPENALLEGSWVPRIKIGDFGFSKLIHSQHSSRKGLLLSYLSPEIMKGKQYDGKMADVWSCGVTLYTMLVGKFPFDGSGIADTYQNIVSANYPIPKLVTESCKDLLSRIFVVDPSKRITIAEIKKHPWFLRLLPQAMTEEVQMRFYHCEPDEALQSLEEIKMLIEEARTIPPWPHL